MTVVIGGGGRRPRQLIASAAKRYKVEDGKVDVRTYDWQKRNWEIFDRVGIVAYGLGTLTYNNLARAQIVPAIVPEDPDQVPEISKDQRERQIVANLNGPYGGPAEVVATAGLNLQVAGEGYLLGRWDELSEMQEWDVVSSQEMQKIGKSAVLVGPYGETEKLGDDDFVCRLWRPHPRWRKLPLARLTSVADDCLEWLLRSRRARGSIRTRLAAGWMFIPEEIRTFTPQVFTDEEGQEVDDWEEPTGANLDKDPLFEELIEIFTSTIKDEDDLAGVVPWLLSGPGEMGDKIVQQGWDRSDEEGDAERRKELARNIATGLDWPIEKVLGMGDSSYWNAWEIDKSSFEEHMDPLIQEVLRSLTIGYYRPMLIEDGMSPEEAATKMLWRDLSNFGQSSMWDKAAVAHERVVISDDALRRYGGFTDDDKPDDDEVEERRKAAAPPPEEDDEDDEAPDDENPGPPASDTDEGEEVSGALVADARLERLASKLAEIDQGLLNRVVTAADQAVNRAVEKAGAKIRSRIVNDKDLAASLSAVENRDLGIHLGRFYVVQQLQFEDEDLIPPNTFDDLAADIDGWVANAQDAAYNEIGSHWEGELSRNEDEEAQDREAGIAGFIAYLIARAVGRLFSRNTEAETGETRPGKVSPAEAMEMMTIAGGGGMSAPEIDRYESGIGNGSRSSEWLQEAGFFTEGYRWDYGDPGARETNFEPHRRLDGIEFVSWVEPALSNTAGYPATAHFYPQDHDGCLCSYERIIVTTEERA